METEQTLAGHMVARVRNGASKQTITEELHAVGWSEEEIEQAYADALVATGVPVPSSESRGRAIGRASTLDIVVNFFSFILLGTVSIALGNLFFNVIDKFFPDPVNDYYWNGNSETIHVATAALIVAFPLYYFVVRFWFRRFREDAAKVESKLTKWLTYLVLLVASVTIVGDLIGVLYTFLQGELTMRFFLKALTLLLISGAVFSFYFLERRKIQYKQEIPRRVFQLFGYVFTGLVLLGIVLGFVATGSPATERTRALDAQRASDLSELSYCISMFSNEFYRLPDSLAELETWSRTSTCGSAQDPETKMPYEYTVLEQANFENEADTQAAARFELCATFSLEQTREQTRTYADKWMVHGVGRECDQETVNITRPTSAVLTAPVPVR